MDKVTAKRERMKDEQKDNKKEETRKYIDQACQYNAKNIKGITPSIT